MTHSIFDNNQRQGLKKSQNILTSIRGGLKIGTVQLTRTKPGIQDIKKFNITKDLLKDDNIAIKTESNEKPSLVDTIIADTLNIVSGENEMENSINLIPIQEEEEKEQDSETEASLEEQKKDIVKNIQNIELDINKINQQIEELEKKKSTLSYKRNRTPHEELEYNILRKNIKKLKDIKNEYENEKKTLQEVNM